MGIRPFATSEVDFISSKPSDPQFYVVYGLPAEGKKYSLMIVPALSRGQNLGYILSKLQLPIESSVWEFGINSLA